MKISYILPQMIQNLVKIVKYLIIVHLNVSLKTKKNYDIYSKFLKNLNEILE